MNKCQTCGRIDYISFKYGVHCLKHFRQIKRYGKVIHGRTDPNIFVDRGSYYEMIIFDKVGNRNGFSKISKIDKKKIEKYRWSFDSLGYAQNSKIRIRLHNFITNAKGIDHINRNRSDNRRSNLRIVSQKINCRNSGISRRNTSGYKGVSKSQSTRGWRSYISNEGKQVSLGVFDKKSNAICARIDAERKLWRKEK